MPSMFVTQPFHATCYFQPQQDLQLVPPLFKISESTLEEILNDLVHFPQ